MPIQTSYRETYQSCKSSNWGSRPRWTVCCPTKIRPKLRPNSIMLLTSLPAPLCLKKYCWVRADMLYCIYIFGDYDHVIPSFHAHEAWSNFHWSNKARVSKITYPRFRILHIRMIHSYLLRAMSYALPDAELFPPKLSISKVKSTKPRYLWKLYDHFSVINLLPL